MKKRVIHSRRGATHADPFTKLTEQKHSYTRKPTPGEGTRLFLRASGRVVVAPSQQRRTWHTSRHTVRKRCFDFCVIAPVRAFIKGPTFADCRRHFLQKKIRQHPTCKQKPINRGTLSFQSCQNPPVFSLLLILCVLIPRAGSPLLADRLANPRQRSASGNLQGDHVPQKKKRKVWKRSKKSSRASC